MADHAETSRVRSLPATDDHRLTLEEIQDVLADEGYSADKRKAWLKEVLTQLETRQRLTATGERSQLVRAIKSIIRDYQNAKPMSDDVL